MADLILAVWGVSVGHTSSDSVQRLCQWSPRGPALQGARVPTGLRGSDCSFWAGWVKVTSETRCRSTSSPSSRLCGEASPKRLKESSEVQHTAKAHNPPQRSWASSLLCVEPEVTDCTAVTPAESQTIFLDSVFKPESVNTWRCPSG